MNTENIAILFRQYFLFKIEEQEDIDKELGNEIIGKHWFRRNTFCIDHSCGSSPYFMYYTILGALNKDTIIVMRRSTVRDEFSVFLVKHQEDYFIEEDPASLNGNRMLFEILEEFGIKMPNSV